MKFRTQQNRGVTLVEVLTSIIVAVIGVAGVLILIPFGIRQAKVGLALDNSTTVADNALAQFEIEGYAQVVNCGGNECLPWIDATVATPTSLINRGANLSSCYWIDPFSAANFTPNSFDNVNTTDNFFLPVGVVDTNAFINGDASSLDGTTGMMVSYQPQFVQMLDLINPFMAGAPQVLNAALRRRMFTSGDDLEFALETDQSGNAIDALAPPQPFFDIDPTRADTMDNDGDGAIDETDELAISRQSGAGITWSAVAVPRRNLGGVNLGSVEGFDFYIMVFSDRDFTRQFPMTQVSAAGTPLVINGTGTITLNAEIDVDNDQWIMLINFEGTPTPQPKVGFFRVIGSDPANNRITIDGLEYFLDVGGVLGLPAQTTFAIALPDVVNVYKRQIELNASSSFIHQ